MADTERATEHESVRWLNSGEFETLLALDREIFEHSWHRNTMDEIVNLRTNLCAVVDDETGTPVGFVIFEVQGDRFYVLKMGVSKDHRRAGYGEELLQFITDRMTPRRNKLEMDVREGLALDSHGFFTSYGFKATGVHADFFKVFTIDSEEPCHVEDSYNFVMEIVFEMPFEPMTEEKKEMLEAAGIKIGDAADIQREFL
jgi:ribosomal protein S18 acetylase RimI-like enzyme